MGSIDSTIGVGDSSDFRPSEEWRQTLWASLASNQLPLHGIHHRFQAIVRP
jgi:hypothetical protein